MLQFATGAAAGLFVTLALAQVSAGATATVASSTSPAPTVVATVAGTTDSVSAVAANSRAYWWVCVTGENLVVDGPRVRCHLPPSTIDMVPACAVGHALVINLSSTLDKCRNMMGGLLDYTCLPEYSRVITSGQDICRRTTNGTIGPPSVKIWY